MGACLSTEDDGLASLVAKSPAKKARKTAKAGGVRGQELNFGKDPALNKADYIVRGKTEAGTVVVKEPGSVNGQQFLIEECENCDIYVLDRTAALSIDDCTNCRIVCGPCESSIFVRNCKGCVLVVSAQQFRTRDCTDCDVLLHSTTQPIIESSSQMRFGCYTLSYFSLASQMADAGLSVWNNCWSAVYNFTGGEEDWSRHSGGISHTTLITTPLDAAVAQRVGYSVEPKDRVVPLTKGRAKGSSGTGAGSDVNNASTASNSPTAAGATTAAAAASVVGDTAAGDTATTVGDIAALAAPGGGEAVCFVLVMPQHVHRVLGVEQVFAAGGGGGGGGGVNMNKVSLIRTKLLALDPVQADELFAGCAVKDAPGLKAAACPPVSAAQKKKEKGGVVGIEGQAPVAVLGMEWRGPGAIESVKQALAAVMPSGDEGVGGGGASFFIVPAERAEGLVASFYDVWKSEI